MGVLRVILAISVIIAHSSTLFGFNFVGGSLAVESFYIISGFYMSLILNEKYIGKKGSYMLFISNRFLRLYPVYWLVLILSIVMALVFGGSVHDHYARYFHQMNFTTFAFLTFSNVMIFFQDAVMFLGLNTNTGNLFFTSDFRLHEPQLYKFLFIPQAWTLGIELLFYIVAPFIVRRGLKVVLILIASSLLLRFILVRIGLDHEPWGYRFFPTELVFFLLGNISYRIYTKIRSISFNPWMLNAAVLFILCFTIFFNNIPLPKKTPVYLVCFLVLLPFIFCKTKNNKLDNYIGELSYPIYISHLFVLFLLTTFKAPIIGGLGLTLTISTIIFSIILNELIAKKIEVLRQRRVKMKYNNSQLAELKPS